MTIAGARRNCVLQIQKRFEGHGKMAALAALGTAPGRDIKTLIVVDEDIDPYDWNEVEWALSTRFDPIEDVELLTGLPGNVADPAMPREAVGKSNLISKIILDATKSLVTPLLNTCQPSRDITAHVRQNWERYGIPSTRKKRLESRG
jgi:UbiD family decarboxylase